MHDLLHNFFSKASLNLFTDDFEMAKFTSNRHGNPKLLDTLGYSYKRQKSNKSATRVYWSCTKLRTKIKCMARATTEGIFIVKHVGEHIHFA